MSDDLDLVERFEALAAADFAPAAPTAALRARVARRRHRRRLVGGSALGVLVVLALLGALLAGRGRPAGEVRTVAPKPAVRKVPASYGTGPRLVVGAVPPAMSSEGCGIQLGEGEMASCSFGIPATGERTSLILLLRPAPAAAQTAWNADDAPAAAVALGWENGTPSFVEIGGRKVLSMGTTGPTTAYLVLIGSHWITVLDQDASDDQVATVVAGLGVEPADEGFAIPLDALPAGARAMAQGQQRLWFTPDRSAPDRSYETGGDVSGITYEVPDVPSYLQVDVVRDVDAESYLETWADQIERTEGLAATDIEAEGRPGQWVRAQFPGVTGELGDVGDRLAVMVDEETVILVSGSVEIADELLAIAGRTTVAAVDPTSATTVPGAGSTDPTGWYLPSGLPDGWTLDRGVAQATDGSGEAQLWLTSPTGNLYVVTLSVPGAVEGHSGQAERHPVPGLTAPVWAEPVGDPGDGPPFQRLRTEQPGAVIEVVALGQPRDEEPTVQGLDETDELIASLVPATTDEWRRALRDLPAPPSLLGASDLEALPDDT